MNDRGVRAPCLSSPLSKITNPVITSQFKLLKASNSSRADDISTNKTIPVTLYINLLTFSNTDKKFELKKDFLKMISNINCNVYIASLWDKKFLYDFAREMFFDVKLPVKNLLEVVHS